MKKIGLVIFALLMFNISFAQKSKVKAMQLLINGGNNFTASNVVPLKIEAIGATKMMISNNSDFKEAQWQDFALSIPQWKLDGEVDGSRTIYVKFKDMDGIESGVLEEKIMLDRTPPAHPSIKIESETGVTNNPARTVNLKLYADDASYMMIGNHDTFFKSKWQSFEKEVKDWPLEGKEDGPKKIFVKFRDQVGNVSDAVFDEIILDTQPPLDPHVAIDYNREVTVDSLGRVMLTIFARGAKEMKVSNSPLFEGAVWMPYATNMRWKLLAQQGTNKVFVKFRDEAGNESLVNTEEKITLDSKAPAVCSVLIDNGANQTTQPDKIVELKLTAKDAKFMMISNTLDFMGARWVAFDTVVKSWKMNGDGVRTVYVRFKDANGNETPVYTDSIEVVSK